MMPEGISILFRVVVGQAASFEPSPKADSSENVSITSRWVEPG